MLPCLLASVALALAQAAPEGNGSQGPTVEVRAVEALPSLPQEAGGVDLLPPPGSGQPQPGTAAGDPQRPAPAPAELTPVQYQSGSAGTAPGKQAGGMGLEQVPQTGSIRRTLPPPWDSPPFPSSDYQGYPLIGIPPDSTRYPLMKALQGTWFGNLLDTERIKVYGWINGSVNWSTSKNSNMPDSYWIVPNSVQMDQTILRIERQLDTAQTDHIDWGYRSTFLYGIDYRYMTAGGWFSDQLLNHNFLYGFDPTEQYLSLYIPQIAEGMVIWVGRWIACPDIETQFAPDNYLGSHSILFTFDTYTQTGVMGTIMLNKQWVVQGCIESGTDMAPWYKGAIATGMFAVRWVSKDNNDSFYTALNNINNAKFRHFDVNGQPAGHDNFNYIVTTWQHRFTREFFTKTEAYYMWQLDGVLGGTPSIGPLRSWGGGGGIGAPIPGVSRTYGVVNYTMLQLSPKSFVTVRNEWWKDEEGERSGFPSTYTSNTIGMTYNITPIWQVRPEIGYYRSWTVPAFDLGTRKNQVMCGMDMTLRF
jgi:hypothetical protein